MNVCDVLAKVDDEILTDESKWTKGGLVNAEGQMCLLGGVCKAVFGTPRPASTVFREGDESYVLYMKVVANLDAEVDDGLGNRTWTFNDALDTEFKDVKALIRRVRSKVCSS